VVLLLGVLVLVLLWAVGVLWLLGVVLVWVGVVAWVWVGAVVSVVSVVVRPAWGPQTGQAPGPWAARTFSATVICWLWVAWSALAA
jgi:hypothetical protein